MAEQPGKRRGRGDEPRTDLPPKKEPYYEGYFGSEEEEGAERERVADEHEDAPARREDPGGNGEGPL
jgi:hypothetical protein